MTWVCAVYGSGDRDTEMGTDTHWKGHRVSLTIKESISCLCTWRTTNLSEKKNWWDRKWIILISALKRGTYRNINGNADHFTSSHQPSRPAQASILRPFIQNRSRYNSVLRSIVHVNCITWVIILKDWISSCLAGIIILLGRSSNSSNSSSSSQRLDHN